uniref:Aa_trans domain-containing protein n=1 Tax=Elaeophora elaphi TaxID=1147741 RepID=A0A0R3RJC4_9BILA
MEELHAAPRRPQQPFHGWKDWTNRNIFAASIDETASLHGYQNLETVGTEDSNVQEVSSLDDEGHTSGQPITALQAAWNVTNAIQGMFIVGLPVAVKVGGWWTVAAIIGVAYLCYWSGILLIDCLYENNVKVRSTYQAVAEAYRPGMGRYVLCAQLTELLSTCIIYIVIAGDLLQSCIPSLDKSALMMLVTAALLGCAFLESIRVVSNLSLINAISHLVINAIIFIYCLFQVPFTFDIRTMPTVIGVVVFGYTSHIFLPSLEGSMEDPTKFKWMLRWSHIIAAVFKALFGLLGFLTFGDFTQKEISNSLPNQTFKVIVNLVLVIKALFSYPLPYFAAVHLLKDNLFLGTQKTLFTSCYGVGHSLREWALCLRIILVLMTLMIAMSVPYLIELMGLVGNITGTMLSFIWPAMFHLKLKEAYAKESDRKFDKFIIGIGIFLMTVGLYFSALELIQAIRYEEQ